MTIAPEAILIADQDSVRSVHDGLVVLVCGSCGHRWLVVMERILVGWAWKAESCRRCEAWVTHGE